MPESAVSHLLLDCEVDVSLLTFVEYFWSLPQNFQHGFLESVQQCKEVDLKPWKHAPSSSSSSGNGSGNGTNATPRYERCLSFKCPIPGFAWLPWLPVHIHSEKTETMEYTEHNDDGLLTIAEFSKVQGIPWHDIDVNLTWKCREIAPPSRGTDEDEEECHGRVHVYVTVQIVFLTPSVIQAFAESQAVAEILRFFANWSREVTSVLESDTFTHSTAPSDGPLAAVAVAVWEASRRKTLAATAATAATTTTTAAANVNSSSPPRGSNGYSLVHVEGGTGGSPPPSPSQRSPKRKSPRSPVSPRTPRHGPAPGAHAITTSAPASLTRLWRWICEQPLSSWVTWLKRCLWLVGDAEVEASSSKHFAFDCHSFGPSSKAR